MSEDKTFGERYGKFCGSMLGLPEDLAANHKRTRDRFCSNVDKENRCMLSRFKHCLCNPVCAKSCGYRNMGIK